jgi:hypothetical protein
MAINRLTAFTRKEKPSADAAPAPDDSVAPPAEETAALTLDEVPTEAASDATPAPSENSEA